jgi:predicted flap endonuclease-1-like 5' DNA nuclease
MLGHVGRIEQENWIEQAQILAKGGDTDYSRRRSATRVDPANPAATVAGAPTTSPGPDRLNRIFGIDAQTEKLLVTNGITRFTDIAGWAGTEVEKVETLLGRPGRVGLENWIEQAKVLSRGVNGEAAPVASLADASREVVAIPAAAPLQAPRPDFSGLRSVRSEALRSEPVGLIPPAVGFSDDLKRIRGIGVLIEKKLNSLGVTAYEQVANWTGADIDRVSQILDFKGRIERENWVEQARILASGGQTEFSRRLDRVEIGIGRDHRG